MAAVAAMVVVTAAGADTAKCGGGGRKRWMGATSCGDVGSVA